MTGILAVLGYLVLIVCGLLVLGVFVVWIGYVGLAREEYKTRTGQRRAK